MTKIISRNHNLPHYSCTLLMLVALLLYGCSKDELAVLDLPFDELQTSYYVLHPNTIEVPSDRYEDLILSRSEDNLVLADDALFDEVDVGTMIISDPYTDREDYIIRRVTEVLVNGDQLEVATVQATHVEAYTEFYLNTRFESVIGVRTTNDFAAVDMGTVNQMFANVGQDPPFTLSPVFEFDGKINFEAIHPHTAYRYFGPCQGSVSCFDNVDKTDNNKNSYYDEVDRFFNNQLVADSLKNGLYTISFDNAGIKKIGISYGTKNGTMGSVDLDPNETPAQIKAKVLAATKQNNANQPKTGLDLKYVPTPLTFWGGFTVTIPAAPILNFEMSSSMGAELTATFPNRLNIQMGHLNWNSTVPDANMDFAVTQNDQPASLARLFDDGSVNMYAGIDGNATLKFGLAIGAAITAGEGNNAGVSMGALMEFSNYYTLSGKVGVRITDILGDRPQDNLTYEGEMCFDMGIDYDFSIFLDANIGPFFGDFFDVKLTAPKAKLGLSKFSMMSLLTPYTPDKGLCIDVTPCGDTRVSTLNIGLTDADVYRMEFDFINEKLAGMPYRVKVVAGTETILLNGPYTYDELNIEDLNGNIDMLRNAILEGTIKVEVEDINAMCSATFTTSDVGFVVSCDDSVYELSALSSDAVFDITNAAGDVVSYFKRASALEYCTDLLSATIPKDVLIEMLRDLPCVVPTGFVLPDNQGNKVVDSNKAYIWIPEEPNGHDLLVIEFIYKPGQNDERKFTTARASESVYAPLICM